MVRFATASDLPRPKRMQIPPERPLYPAPPVPAERAQVKPVVIVKKPAEPDPTSADISQMAHQFVGMKLKAPSTARYSRSDEETIKKIGPRKWRVSGYVDSQNSFGAMLRNRFECNVMHKGGENYSSDDVDLMEQ